MTDEIKVRIHEDDRFFAAQLDLIPRALLVPKTDEARQAHYEKIQERRKHKKMKKQLKKQQKNGKHVNANDDDDDDNKARNSRKRTFAVRSNEEALAEATKEQQHMDRATSWQQSKKSGAKDDKSEASLGELRARLQTKIDSQRQKGGVPGTRAERDKLLPPKAQRAERLVESEAKSEEPLSEGVHLEQKKTKKEELEAKLSFGLLKLDKPVKRKDIPDKPERSATSTNSIINVKKLIKQAEKSQARVEALRAQGRDDVVADEKWDALERKAAGEKLRDDPKMLKKALKRLEKQKSKSGKDWQERKSREKDTMQESRDEKAKNVADRRVKKIEKRGGVVQNKPGQDDQQGHKRRRPGFEGAKSRFNSPGNRKPGDKGGNFAGGNKKRQGGDAPKSPFAGGGNKKARFGS